MIHALDHGCGNSIFLSKAEHPGTLRTAYRLRRTIISSARYMLLIGRLFSTPLPHIIVDILLDPRRLQTTADPDVPGYTSASTGWSDRYEAVLYGQNNELCRSRCPVCIARHTLL